MYIIPQRAKKSTNKIIKFDKKFTVSGVISIYLAYTIKNEVSNSRMKKDAPLPEAEIDIDELTEKYLNEEKHESFFDD